jgi:CRISPR/Cas system Type II protein with McrA/HNH and RuvC-like nuclease domain
MKLSDKFYEERLKEQNGKCYYCGIVLIKGVRPKSNIDIDHIKPFSKYKDGTRKNLCLSCHNCNMIKLDLEIEEFRIKAKGKGILKNNKFNFEIK